MSIEIIKKALSDSADLKMQVAELLPEKILKIAEALSSTIERGGKAMFCGNGGSAADSQHLAAEMVVRLTGQSNRRALPAMALTTDSSILTACSNDFGFETVFARQIEALANKGDILFAISTSGNSPNVILAVETARKKDIVTVGLLGSGGGKLAGITDHPLVIPSSDTQRIQEAHIAVGHIIISLVEKKLCS